MATSQPTVAPPRGSHAALRAVLPSDSMGDAIVGDLHEEFVDEVARLGPLRARRAYHRRAAAIIVRAVVDSLRWRAWTSSALCAELPRAGMGAFPPAPARTRAGVGRADAGIVALALGVLSVGIVANTLLFSTVRHAAPAARGGSTLSSALGIGAVVLALVCAGAAALVLCAGPRWLRRRAATARRARQEA